MNELLRPYLTSQPGRRFCGLAFLLVWQGVAAQAVTVTNIAGGYAFSMFAESDGSLWTMGYNNSGQLGAGITNNYRNTPTLIVASNVTRVAGGFGHSLFLKSDGSLWGAGNNADGELGDGTYTSTNAPKQIVASGVTAMAAGDAHTLFLKNDGSLWGTGYTGSGELGDGTSNLKTNLPEQIISNGVIAVAAGASYSLFLKSNGSLWGMGQNWSGQLGNTTGGNVSTNLPVLIVASNVTAIAAGGAHTLLLKTDGSLWGMGNDANGQIGNGLGEAITNVIVWNPVQIVASNVTAVAAGGAHSHFLKSDGSLWGMGNNSFGQLGNGTTNAYVNLPVMAVSGGVTAIAAGAYQLLLLKSDGSLWVAGRNTFGQLGDGTFTDRPTPVQIVGPPVPPQILSAGLMGTNFTMGFATISNQPYTVQSITGLTTTNWSDATNFIGNGQVMQIALTVSNGVPNQFFRIKQP